MKKVFFVFSFILTLTTHSVAATPHLVFGTVENIPPYSYLENNKLTGIDIELAKEMAKRIGSTIEIRTYPWARVLENLKEGVIDGALTVYRTKEREEFCFYIENFRYDELYLAVSKEKRIPFLKIENLYGKVIGKGTGVFVNDEFDSAVKKGLIKVEEVNDMDMSNIMKLLNERIDAVIGSKKVLENYIDKLQLRNKLEIIPKPIEDKIPAFIVLSKKTNLKSRLQIQQQIKTTLKRMRQDGTYKKIFSKFGLNYDLKPESSDKKSPQ